MDSQPNHTEDRFAPPCACGGRMTLVRVHPRVGGLAELRSYRCETCGHVETVEARPGAAPADAAKAVAAAD